MANCSAFVPPLFVRVPLFVTRARRFFTRVRFFSHHCETWCHGYELFLYSRDASGNGLRISRKSCEFFWHRQHFFRNGGTFSGIREAFSRNRERKLRKTAPNLMKVRRNAALLAPFLASASRNLPKRRLFSHPRYESWHALRLFSHGGETWRSSAVVRGEDGQSCPSFLPSELRTTTDETSTDRIAPPPRLSSRITDR